MTFLTLYSKQACVVQWLESNDSDQTSQATLGEVSTWMGVHLFFSKKMITELITAT